MSVDYSIADAGGATIRSKPVRNFAIVIHRKDCQIGVFAGLDAAFSIRYAKGPGAIDGCGGDRFRR